MFHLCRKKWPLLWNNENNFSKLCYLCYYESALGWDIRVYIHNRGDEIWLGMNLSPVEIASIKIDNENTDGIEHADITFIETETTFLNKESRFSFSFNFNFTFHHLTCIVNLSYSCLQKEN